jgi:predicted nucleic acid-binding protein
VARRRFILDTNCYVDASRDGRAALELEEFSAAAAPQIYLSAVVASELRAGAGAHGRRLERELIGPFKRRERIVTPTGAAWATLGNTLATLRAREGLLLKTVPRSFILDILLAYSCRESGAVLITRNLDDMKRIARVFRFDFTAPYPSVS